MFSKLHLITLPLRVWTITYSTRDAHIMGQNTAKHRPTGIMASFVTGAFGLQSARWLGEDESYASAKFVSKGKETQIGPWSLQVFG